MRRLLLLVALVGCGEDTKPRSGWRLCESEVRPPVNLFIDIDPQAATATIEESSGLWVMPDGGPSGSVPWEDDQALVTFEVGGVPSEFKLEVPDRKMKLTWTESFETSEVSATLTGWLPVTWNENGTLFEALDEVVVYFCAPKGGFDGEGTGSCASTPCSSYSYGL